MATEHFAQRVLFAEDVIKYFMDRCQVQWTPGTGGNIWDGHLRRFSESMGSTAFHLNEILSFRKFTLNPKDGPTFEDGYNHLDFLHYLGVIGMDSVRSCADGDDHIVDSNVLGIVVYLGRVIEDGTFQAEGGWCELFNFAWRTKLLFLRELVNFIQR